MKLNYIDLFCGAGGLGEGFTQAGFSSALHIDSDHWAMETIRLREIYHRLESTKQLNDYFSYLQNCNGPFSSSELSDNHGLGSFLAQKTLEKKIMTLT